MPSFTPAAMEPTEDLYEALGLSRGCTGPEIRRSFRTLATKLHPDRAGGGPAELARFRSIQAAYEVLSDPQKKSLYDATGRVERGADEEFRSSFAGGQFKDKTAGDAESDRPALDALIALQKTAPANSHTAGFEAWLRSRGEEGSQLFTSETVADQFGVNKASYTPVPLQPADVCMVAINSPGAPANVMQLTSERLEPALEWGCVLVEWRYAPISPGDLYSARVGGIYGSDTSTLPYVGGHDGVGVVRRVGPGVKALCEGDVVLPGPAPFMGTWRSACSVREAELIRLPPSLTALVTDRAAPATPPPPANGSTNSSSAEHRDGNSKQQQPQPQPQPQQVPSKAGGSGSGRVGLEMLAMSKELALAHLLLEKHGSLKAGDCVLLNAATSSVGQTILQLCRLLKLRAVAVARAPTAATQQAASNGASSTPAGAMSEGEAEAAWARTEAMLKAAGASVVVRDEGSVKVALDSLRFFSRPKLALDAVGGYSAVRLTEALAEGGECVCYGAISGKPPAFQWQSFVFRELKVSGFNLRRYLSGGARGSGTASRGASSAATATQRLVPVLESVMKLVDAGLLDVAFTEYNLEEFAEALDHAMTPGRHTKVLLRMPPAVGRGG